MKNILRQFCYIWTVTCALILISAVAMFLYGLPKAREDIMLVRKGERPKYAKYSGSTSSGALGRYISYSHYQGIGYRISIFELEKPIDPEKYPFIPNSFWGDIIAPTFPVSLLNGWDTPIPNYNKYNEPNK